MKKLAGVVASLACLCAATQVLADPPEGRGYKKHHHHEKSREYKEEYWEGNCKVERKYKENGDYKEERKCEGAPYYSRGYEDDYAPPPPAVVYDYPPPPPAVVYDYPPPPPAVEAEIVVRPPVVVLEAPSVVITPPRVIIE